jgi:hypothetical protein
MGSIPAMDEDRERLLQIDGAMPRLNAIPSGCAFNPRCPAVFDRCRQRAPDLMPAGAPGRLLAARRRGVPMSGQGPALVEVHDLVKTFDVSAPWLNRVLERKPAPVRARGRRRQLCHRARPHAGAGGRVRLRQEHGGAPAGGPVPPSAGR